MNKDIQNLVSRISKHYNPEKIILFGSYAWGEPTEDSDVDLLIIKKTDVPKRQRTRELINELFPIGLAVDFLIYTPEEIEYRESINDLFVKKILTEGKAVYEQRY